MIYGNMATYPKRADTIEEVVNRIAPQLDILRVVLNEFEDVPPGNYPDNVEFLFPEEDLKDVGKFYPETKDDASFIFLLDDDILYPSNYVERTLEMAKRYDKEATIFGYHASIYLPFDVSLNPKSWYGAFIFKLFGGNLRKSRRVFHYERALDRCLLVDQLGTGAVSMKPEYMPPFEIMAGSAKFTDVRLSKWAHAKGIKMRSLERADKWLDILDFDENIYKTFTRRTPEHVLDEIRTFAGKATKR